MIDNDFLRRTVVSGLSAYLGNPVIRFNQNATPPPYPYTGFTVTMLQSENKGTYGEYSDGVDRKPTTQLWSVSSLSDDEEESVMLAWKAHEWLEHAGRVYLSDNGIIVQSVGSIGNRDNVLTVEYEYKNGFDVVFYMLDEVGNWAETGGDYISEVQYGDIEASTESTILYKNLNEKNIPTLVDLSRWKPFDLSSSGMYGATTRCIPRYMFSATGANDHMSIVEKVILPKGITGIGVQAFFRCQNLIWDEDFDMSQLEKIGTNAFCSCYSFVIPNLNLPKIKEISAGAFQIENAFHALPNLTGNVVLGSVGNAVNSIGASAFENQTAIETLTIYTADGNPLPNAPWGAVNAEITYIQA